MANTEARFIRCLPRTEIDQLNLHRRTEGQPEIDGRFGAHPGPEVISNLGSDRLEHAAIGSSMNLASWMEELSRTLKTKAKFSDADLQTAGIPQGVTEASTHPVRGAQEPMEVWTMIYKLKTVHGGSV